MPDQYNAESEIVVPVPKNPALDDILFRFGSAADIATLTEGRPPGVAFVAGMELGIESALRDPETARKVLGFIDSSKAEAATREGAVENAEARGQAVELLLNAGNGIALPEGNITLGEKPEALTCAPIEEVPGEPTALPDVFSWE